MNVFAKFWHQCGAECLIQFDGQLEPIQSMPAFVEHLRKQGWLTKNPNAPTGGGLTRYEIGSVSRRATIQNGKTIDIIDFYGDAPNLKHKLATLYLDRPERINGFTQFSGLQPSAVPMNPGQAAIQQGTPAAASYIVPCRKLVVVVEPNPSYDPAKAEAAKVTGAAPYKTSPKQFVRFEAPGQQAAPGTAPGGGVGQSTMSGSNGHTGPVNGVISDPDFRKLLLAKGLTWYVAMQRIDHNRGTNLAATAKTVADIPADILDGFTNWLRGRPDVQQRPHEPTQSGGGIPF